MSDLTTLKNNYLAKRHQRHFNELKAVWDELVTQLNNMQLMMLAAVTATSSSEATIQPGEQAITLDGVDDKGFVPDMRINVGAGGGNSMAATVVSFNPITRILTFDVEEGDTLGSGTFTAWNISLSGDEGKQGEPGEAFWDAVRSVDHTTDDDSSGNVVAGAKSFLKCDVTGGAIAIAVQVATDRLALVPEGTLSDANYIRITPPAGKEIFGQGADNAVVIRRPIRGLAIFKDENGNYW